MCLKRLWLIRSSLVALVLTGCAHTSNISKPALVSSDSDISQPFLVSIIEEANDGKKLTVAAEVRSHWKSDSSKALLQLKGLKNGEVVGESFFPLASAPECEDGTLSPDEKVQTVISVDSPGITDYQLNLLWGDEAQAYLRSLPVGSTVLFKDLNLTLKPKAAVVGEIENRGSDKLDRVAIAVSFVWVPNNSPVEDGQSQQETILEIGDLNLSPGKSRPFSIEIDQEIPASPDGYFKPLVRVVERPAPVLDSPDAKNSRPD